MVSFYKHYIIEKYLKQTNTENEPQSSGSALVEFGSASGSVDVGSANEVKDKPKRMPRKVENR